jgi:hypothetical protein
MSFDLQAYLIERNLYEPNVDVDALILDDEQLLHEIADLWRGHRKAIERLLQSRLQPIREEIVLKAHPAEVMPLRQSIVEVASIADMLERYAAEHERRTKAKEGEEQPADEGENPSSTD